MSAKPPHVGPTPHDDVLTSMAASLKILAGGIQPTVETLRKQAKRTRRILRAAVIGLIFDLLLSLALGVNAVRTERALTTAQNSQEAALLVCEEANNLRRAELNLWLPLLVRANEPGAPPRTPEQIEAAEQFEAALRQSFSPQDCSKFR